MISKTATIETVMTPNPHSIGREQTLDIAHQMLRKYGIRHLPVLHGGELVGILSLRDLHLVETLPDVDPAKVTVEEAMTDNVYTVAPNAPLREVAAHMSEHKLGTAVVMHGARVLGLFTTTDALKALSEALS